MSALADRGRPVARALATPLDLGCSARPTSTPPPIRESCWTPDAAHRWLSVLADHLQTIGSHDIAWWRLHRMVAIRPVHRLAAGLALGLAFGTVAGLAGALSGALSHEPLAGLTGGLVAGVAGGPVAGLTTGLTAKPAFMDLRLRGRFRALVRGVTAKLAMGVPVGLVAVAVGWFGSAPLAAVLTSGLAGGSLGGLVIGLLEWATTPLPDDLAQTPPGTLRRDLGLMFGRTMSGLVLGGFLLGLATGLVGWSVVVLVVAFEGAVAVLLRFRTVGWIGSASSIYLCAMAFLRWRGHVPGRMMRFLDDAPPDRTAPPGRAGLPVPARQAPGPPRADLPPRTPVRDEPLTGGLGRGPGRRGCAPGGRPGTSTIARSSSLRVVMRASSTRYPRYAPQCADPL